MKYFLTLILLLYCLQLSAQVDLNNGLIGCYPFSGNAKDLSSSNNDGFVNGAKLTADRFENPNSAYDFDGIDDFIEISPKYLELNEFSYSLWLKPKELPEYQKAFFIFSIGSDLGDQYVLIGNQYPNVLHGISNGSYVDMYNNVRCMTGDLPKLDQWYHIVLAKDVDNYYFYVNGILLCTNPTNGLKAYYGISKVRAIIGARNNYGQAVKATIDDIHLFNRAITADEVNELFKGPSLIQQPEVIVHQDIPSPCGGDQINITASAAAPGDYKWQVDGVVLADELSNKISYNLPYRNSDYSITVVAELSSPLSCFPFDPVKQEKIIFVKDCSTSPNKQHMIIPNTFTPNNDGINDTWKILNHNIYANFKISVFSRWGEIIFQSVGYSTPWDGIWKGKLISPGSYPYHIHSDKTLIRRGVLNIIY